MSIYAKLDAARAAFPTIVKNRTNPHFKSRYADLEEILSKVEPVLRENGLGLFQSTSDLPTPGLVTEVHELEGDGVLACALPLPADVDSQKLGSAITYARRYGIVTLLGLVTEDDDDGNAATPPSRGATTPSDTKPEAPPLPPAPAGWLSDADCDQAHRELVARITQLPPADIERARKFRDSHGGIPLSVEDFNALKQLVDAAEETQKVVGAFPGATATS